MTVQLSQDTQPDYYAILGVGASATTEQIKAAFRLRVKQVHPDRNPSPEATDRFIALTEAYRILADIRIRGLYDQARRSAPVPARVRAAPARGGPTPARRARRASRRPSFGTKAACFAGALVACCCLVVDFGLDFRLMAAARASDMQIEDASRVICRATPARPRPLRHRTSIGIDARN